jgi:hypothetical protein
MKRLACDNIQVFFENTRCLHCGRELGFVPEILNLCALEPAGGGEYLAVESRLQGRRFRKCLNYSDAQVCNWMVDAGDPAPYCRACRLNRMIPDLSLPQNLAYWREIEAAKRRLLYTLLALDMPLAGKDIDHANGLAFAFLADTSGYSEFTDDSGQLGRIMTGYQEGLITINIAEADPEHREHVRKEMNESYRTLLGHFRHEIGHYYWHRLIKGSPHYPRFVELFGPEVADYGVALRRYYASGAPAGWQERHISAYASAHPWEDWAECFAHYLHIIDTLETTHSSRLLGAGPFLFADNAMPKELCAAMLDVPMDRILDVWIEVALALNNINRSIGINDFYPFVINAVVREKLVFIHDVVHAAAGNGPS